MSRNILVVADIRNGKLRNVSFEMLHTAKKLVNGGVVHALLLGYEVKGFADVLAKHGADKVHVVEQEVLKNYSPDAYVKALRTVIDSLAPNLVMFAHSAIGRDVAPALAAKYQAGQVSDIIAIADDNGTLVCTRPIYAGKAFTKVTLGDGMSFVTVRPNNLEAGEADDSRTAEVVETKADIPADSLRTFIREIVQKSTSGVDLS
jgi:electron transfer flavoprotein alpha subunit